MINEYQHDLLIDTGASVSAIKQECLEYLKIPFHNERVKVKGIGGDVFSKGYVYLNLNYNGHIFKHKFLVMKQLPCKTNGILGQDFLRTYKAILDFELCKLYLTSTEGKEISLHLDFLKTNFNSYITLPARCESVHFIDTYLENDCVIAAQQLCEGVFVANTLSRPNNGKVAVRILNTRETDVNLNYLQLTTCSLDDYFICQFEKPKINSDRVKLLFSLLNLKHLNDESQ